MTRNLNQLPKFKIDPSKQQKVIEECERMHMERQEAMRENFERTRSKFIKRCEVVGKASFVTESAICLKVSWISADLSRSIADNIHLTVLRLNSRSL